MHSLKPIAIEFIGEINENQIEIIQLALNTLFLLQNKIDKIVGLIAFNRLLKEQMKELQHTIQV